jgi:multisubunit Na+/H+ antiporter MnhB subunit
MADWLRIAMGAGFIAMGAWAIGHRAAVVRLQRRFYKYLYGEQLVKRMFTGRLVPFGGVLFIVAGSIVIIASVASLST